jgi:hypothetical protein
MFGKDPERVDDVAPEYVGVLAGCLSQQIERRAQPQATHLARTAFRVTPLVAKVGGHRIAEVAAEL